MMGNPIVETTVEQVFRIFTYFIAQCIFAVIFMSLRELWLKIYEKQRKCLEDTDALCRFIKFNNITD